MNPKVRTVLVSLLPTVVVAIHLAATSVTPGSVAALILVAIGGALSALEPSLSDARNVAAVQAAK